MVRPFSSHSKRESPPKWWRVEERLGARRKNGQRGRGETSLGRRPPALLPHTYPQCILRQVGEMHPLLYAAMLGYFVAPIWVQVASAFSSGWHLQLTLPGLPSHPGPLHSGEV